MLISYVIPCYRSEQTIGGVVADIKKTITENTDYSYEIILVNDCSPDGVYNVLQQLAAEDSNVKVINLAKNFGQHSALMAGLNRTKGDIVVCLDDDGQTPPSESLKLISALDENVDVVYASYDLDGKKHSGFRNFGSMANDLMLQKLLGKSKDLKVTSFFAAKNLLSEKCAAITTHSLILWGLCFAAQTRLSMCLFTTRKDWLAEAAIHLKACLNCGLTVLPLSA